MKTTEYNFASAKPMEFKLCRGNVRMQVGITGDGGLSVLVLSHDGKPSDAGKIKFNEKPGEMDLGKTHCKLAFESVESIQAVIRELYTLIQYFRKDIQIAPRCGNAFSEEQKSVITRAYEKMRCQP